MSAPVNRFAILARDRYVGFLDQLSKRTDIEVPLNRLGILEVAAGPDEAAALETRGVGRWLDAAAVADVEPAVRAEFGALFFELDGSVDNLTLLRALRLAIECEARITEIDALVISVGVDRDGVTCTVGAGNESYQAPLMVLAAGSWSPRIAGLPRPLPIEPMRGQMFSVSADSKPRLRHVVYGPDAYVVPRGDRVLVGATLEQVGFDATTTPEAIATLRTAAARIWPPVETAPAAARWAGLRPMTPDRVPIIGRDPEQASVIYATGHSRNGILMAPLTGDCVAAVATGETPPADLSAFRVDRFPATPRRTT
jgi:glycine oxidase